MIVVPKIRWEEPKTLGDQLHWEGQSVHYGAFQIQFHITRETVCWRYLGDHPPLRNSVAMSPFSRAHTITFERSSCSSEAPVVAFQWAIKSLQRHLDWVAGYGGFDMRKRDALPIVLRQLLFWRRGVSLHARL